LTFDVSPEFVNGFGGGERKRGSEGKAVKEEEEKGQSINQSCKQSVIF